MKRYTVIKVDTNLYIKGFSGQLVFRALYGIIAAFLLFTALYILAGGILSVLVCLPLLLGYLIRLKRIQNTLGPTGWQKKQVSQKLPCFVTIKKRMDKINAP